MSLPLVKPVVDYVNSIPSHMDFEGQRKAERIYQIIITLFGIVGFIWGFYIQRLSATVFIVLGGFALSCLIVLPPWPFFRKHALEWQAPIVKPAPGTKPKDSKKKGK